MKNSEYIKKLDDKQLAKFLVTNDMIVSSVVFSVHDVDTDILVKAMFNYLQAEHDDGNISQCPFCGGYGVVEYDKSESKYYVFCSNCKSKSKHCKTKQEAIKSWNERFGCINV